MTKENGSNFPQLKNGYTGLQNFHKYWGKKPSELMFSLIDNFTKNGDTVLDPFVGYGSIARECVKNNRKFIGFDVNPIAIRLAKIISNPPNLTRFIELYNILKDECELKINQSYRHGKTGIASHYLWDGEDMQQVWQKGNCRSKNVSNPVALDYEMSANFSEYKPKKIRNLVLFHNSRINSHPELQITDFFTGRALRNIELLLEQIELFPESLESEALKLCLTSSLGQMSKMVFAVTGRGKTKGQTSKKTEVGSWSIGFWRPQVHFEINVWNCFERRVMRMLNSCSTQDNLFSDTIPDLRVGDCITHFSKIKSDSIDLIVTDPPHSDRIPYLELSELWNAVLNEQVNFESEIIVSNAIERNKTFDEYVTRMKHVFNQFHRTIKPEGLVIIIFNSRKKKEWNELKLATENLTFVGSFSCQYSAGSIVQDNRKGGLKEDIGLVFAKGKNSISSDELIKLEQMPEWNQSWPS